MARRTYLFTDQRGNDAYFAGANNVKCQNLNKGTLAVWRHTEPGVYYGASGLCYFRLYADANNYISETWGRSLVVKSAGTAWNVNLTNNIVGGSPPGHGIGWELMVYTWDFSGGNGHGILNSYWDGITAPTPVTTANALANAPSYIYLGSAPGVYHESPTYIYSLGIWDDVMTQAQVTALVAQGNRFPLVAGAGTGNALLIANFNGQYNADQAAGDSAFHVGSYTDRHALIHDGALSVGKRSFLLGQPRHDASDDDRLPVNAVLTEYAGNGTTGDRGSYLTPTNLSNMAQLVIAPGYSSTSNPLGWTMAQQPVFPGGKLVPPMTYRQKIYAPGVAATDNPVNKLIRIGPIDYLHAPLIKNDLYDNYGSGAPFTVVADAGNTASQFKTNITGYVDGYFVGATLYMMYDNTDTDLRRNQALRVSGYTATGGIITLSGALGAVPVAGDMGVVDFGARLQGCQSAVGGSGQGSRIPEMNMEAWLWDEFGGIGNPNWQTLEWVYGNNYYVNLDDSNNFLRYERGRTTLMDGCPAVNSGNGFGYGLVPLGVADAAFFANIWLERIELLGPTTYEVITARDASGDGVVPGDNFMVVAENGDSTKVWRKSNMTYTKTAPTKCTSPTLVVSDLRATGTWRQTVTIPPLPVSYDPVAQAVTCLVTGNDASSVTRYGYCVGTWNSGTGRISWVDETPPAGKSNPFMLASNLAWDKSTGATSFAAWPEAVLQGADGNWYMVFNAMFQYNIDGQYTYLLGPCPDRYSFDRQASWWSGNPLVPPTGGPDRLSPQGNGGNWWANRDVPWSVVKSPSAHNPTKLFWGATGAKGINNTYQYIGDARYPPVAIKGGDLRSMRPMPHGNMLSPLAATYGVVFPELTCLAEDCFLLQSEGTASTAGVLPYVSEDGIHWQMFMDQSLWIQQGVLPGEAHHNNPSYAFRLGSRMIYYYSTTPVTTWAFNFASIRYQGEAQYALTGGQTSGYLETCLIEKPSAGWGALHLNMAPGNGTLTVEVRDGNEQPITGFAAGNCDALTDNVDQHVTWGGADLQAIGIGVATIRLRFNFACASGTSPALYAWLIADPIFLPTIAAVSPSGSSVAVGSTITVQFSLPMVRSTVEAALGVSPSLPGTVSFAWSSGDTTVTIVPEGNLTMGTQYTVTVGTGAQATNGQDLASQYQWQFTTAMPPTPTVTAHTPTGTTVALGATISLTFSQAMDRETTEKAFSTSPAITGGFSWNSGDTVLTFIPEGNLSLNTAYTVTLAATAKSQAGVTIGSQFSWSFTTLTYPAPTASGATPTGTGAALAAQPSVTFSVPMDRATTEAAFSISPSVAGGFAWSSGDTVLTFIPADELDPYQVYTVTIGTGAHSAVGVALAAAVSWGFTTVSVPAATDARIDGLRAPRSITNPHPVISWTYVDAGGSPQAAYQVLITSPAGVDAGTLGDMFNSGVVSGAGHSVTYAGEALQNDTLYVPTVRVQNAAGEWSN